MTDRGQYALSPAFDVLPSGHALRYQQMRVGRDMMDATLVNALSECLQFGLSLPQAEREVRRVAKVVSDWQSHFALAGVSARHVALLVKQLDGPFLRDQRQAWLGRHGSVTR